jgi:hypothetical protein
MQNTTFFVAANETLGVVRDYANAKTSAAPTLVRGVAVCLKMRLFAKREGLAAYPLAALSGIASWQWAMDNDFNESTTYKLVGENGDITASEVVDTVEGEEITYTEISIPIPDMNTVELAAWMGADKSKSGLHGELVGLDAEGRQVFIVQVENFTVRNRITSLGEPTPVAPDFLTAAQVRALLAAGMECSFSADGEAWHGTQAAEDTLARVRLRGEANGLWSDPVALVAGPRGLPGASAYCYVAYASDASGAGFSLTAANGLKYRAEIHPAEPLSAPVAADFAGLWVKYLGDDGTGVGDMTREEYDADADGKVDAAEEADHAALADAAPWDGVSGKPAAFPPSAHTHSTADLADPVRQRVQVEGITSTLYLDRPILMNSGDSTNEALVIEFTAIKTTPGGGSYTGVSGDVLTWEYHVRTSVAITSIAIGGLQSSMVGITIPDTLSLINQATTVHVFVVRGIYKPGAVNGLMLQVNYAYSYGA